MRKTIRKKTAMLVIFILMMVFASMVYSHCQIPCGIYNDPARFDMIAEHTTTIEKSMKQITNLSKHELSHIVTHYFMAQRIKPAGNNKGKAYEEYIRKLTLLHEMLVYSMKAKQTTDLSNVEKLKTLLAEFRVVYFQVDTHKH